MLVRVLVVVLFALFLPQLAGAQERELAQASPCDPDKLELLKAEAKLNGERVYNLGTFGDAPFWNPRTYALKNDDTFVKLMLNDRTRQAFLKNGMTETDLIEVETLLKAGRFEETMLECGDKFDFMVSQDWRGMTTIVKGRMGFNVKAILVTLSDGRQVGLIYWCGNPILIPAPPAPASVEFLPAVEDTPLKKFVLRKHVPLVIPTDVCVNIDGVQVTVPTGMDVDRSGNCDKPRAEIKKSGANWPRRIAIAGIGFLLYKGIESKWGNPPTTPEKQREGPGGQVIIGGGE